TAASSACEKPGASVSGPAQPGAQITKVVVSPDGVSLFSSQRKQFTAYGRTEAGDSVAVAVSWSSSGGTISSSGVYVAGPTPGHFGVVATQTGGSLAGSAALTVWAGPVAVQAGGRVQLWAAGGDSGGGVVSGRVVTWMSCDGSVAIVSGSGLVTAVAPGQATITATSEGKSGNAAITVASPSGGGTVLLQEK